MAEYDKGDGRRLLVGYTDYRARKDAYNREKDIRRLEKAYKRGTLTKDNINRCGYNKFLKMEGDIKVAIDYDKLEVDAKWDGLKKDILPIQISPPVKYMPHIITCGMLKGHSASRNRK